MAPVVDQFKQGLGTADLMRAAKLLSRCRCQQSEPRGKEEADNGQQLPVQLVDQSALYFEKDTANACPAEG